MNDTTTSGRRRGLRRGETPIGAGTDVTARPGSREPGSAAYQGRHTALHTLVLQSSGAGEGGSGEQGGDGLP